MNRSGWDKAILWTLYLSLLAPVLYSHALFFPYVTLRAVFLVSLAILASVGLAAGSSRRGSKALIPWVVAVFVATQVLSAITGVDLAMSFWSQPDRMTGVLSLLAAFVLFLAMIRTLRSSGDWEHFFAASIAVGIAVGLLHLGSSWGLVILESTNTGSTIGNSTLFGAYLLFQIAFAFYLAFSGTTRRWRVYGLGAALFLSGVLFSTDARAAQVSLIGGLLFVGALALLTHSRRLVRRMGFVAVGALAITFFSIVVLLFVPTSRVHERFIDLTDEARFTVWEIAWQGIVERPILGWGPETFEYLFWKHNDPCFGSSACGVGYWFDRAHNVILDILAGSGFLGLAAYAAIFVAAVVLLWRAHKRSAENRAAFILVTATLAGYLVQNLTGFDSLVSIIAWMTLLAFAHVAARGFAVEQPTRVRCTWQVWVAAAVAPFALWYLVAQPLIAFASVQNAVEAAPRDEHMAALERALSVSSAGRSYRRAYLAHQTNVVLWHTPTESAMTARDDIVREMGMVREALLDTLARTPAYLPAYLQLGRLNQIEGRFYRTAAFEDARQALALAVERSPNNPIPAWALASVLLEQGKMDEAVALTQEVLDRDPRVFKAHTAHLVALKFTGDEERLLRQAQESARVLPELAGQIQFIVSADLEENRLLFLGHFY